MTPLRKKATHVVEAKGTRHAHDGPRPVYRLSELAAKAGMSKRRIARMLRRHGVRIMSEGREGQAQFVMLSALQERFPDLIASIEMAQRETLACPSCGDTVECTNPRCGWCSE